MSREARTDVSTILMSQLFCCFFAAGTFWFDYSGCSKMKQKQDVEKEKEKPKQTRESPEMAALDKEESEARAQHLVEAGESKMQVVQHGAC